MKDSFTVTSKNLKDKHILDTSAWNALFDDPLKDIFIKIFKTKTIIPTALNVSEIAAEPNQERRYSLLRFVKTACRDIRPLAIPNQLIILACQGYARRDPYLTLCGGSDAEGSWIALNDPALVDAEGQRMALEFNQEREKVFRQTYEQLRNDFNNIFKSGVERPPSLNALIQHYCKNEDFLYEMVNPIYKRAVGDDLPRNEIRQLLNSLPHWGMFLKACACGIYQRAVLEHGFGNRRNPGILDLWSGIYLPSCEVFVTNDKGQAQALRELNNGYMDPAQIFYYPEWKKRIT
jgi:hypothetical protein